MQMLYKVRLMFEWGGGCIWCGNDAALERFDLDLSKKIYRYQRERFKNSTNYLLGTTKRLIGIIRLTQVLGVRRNLKSLRRSHCPCTQNCKQSLGRVSR